MKRFSEQFNTKAKSIRLTAAEKRDLKERVISYMEYHPLPQSAQKATAVESPYTVFGMSRSLWRTVQLSGAFVLVLGLSVSYIAERAVPGDALYAIKIGFNEELRSTLARSSYEKVVWETERLNRRIAEARLLANEGRLTEEVEAQVASAVKVHSENARKEIENLKLTDKDEATLASIELTTALDVQSTSLKNRSEDAAVGQSTDLIEVVLEASQAAEAIAEADNLPAYDRLLAKVESETTRAHELLRGIAKSATPEEQKDINRRLEDIERKIGEAMGLGEDENVAARERLVAALQQTHRLIVFMTNIDVRASLTVDQIVPVTLTREERIQKAKDLTIEAKAMLGAVDEALLATTTTPLEAELLLKIEPALADSKAKVQIVDELMQVDPIDVDQLESVVSELSGTAGDLVKLLNIRVQETPVVVPEEVVATPATTTEALEESIETGTSTDPATATTTTPSATTTTGV